MDEELKELREYIMDEELPYLSAKKGLWKQADGKLKSISSMVETHLKSSIKMIERDIEGLRDRPKEISDELISIAENKMEELRDEYISRI